MLPVLNQANSFAKSAENAECIETALEFAEELRISGITTNRNASQ